MNKRSVVPAFLIVTLVASPGFSGLPADVEASKVLEGSCVMRSNQLFELRAIRTVPSFLVASSLFVLTTGASASRAVHRVTDVA